LDWVGDRAEDLAEAELRGIKITANAAIDLVEDDCVQFATALAGTVVIVATTASGVGAAIEGGLFVATSVTAAVSSAGFIAWQSGAVDYGPQAAEWTIQALENPGACAP
jgi:hypothetical protein